MKNIFSGLLLALVLAALSLTIVNQAETIHNRHDDSVWTFYMQQADVTCVMVRTDGERTMACEPGKRPDAGITTLDEDE